MADIEKRAVADIAAAIRSGELTSADLAEWAIANHEARGENLNAYTTWDAARVRAEAALADGAFAAHIDLGPLQGIPVSVKDIFGVQGYPIHAGSPRELPPEWRREGPVVRALRHQLAVVSGKTNTVQFAFGALGTNPHWGAPWNPWDAGDHRAPGGSSAGAGVSLWEGSALLALGTDTAGSVRMPAAMTGTAGIKTTKHRWSTDGITPLSTSLDTPGVLSRSVDDGALAFSVIDPDASRDPEAFLVRTEDARMGDFRLGVCDAYFEGCDPGIAEGVRDALAELEAAGARLIDVDVPGLDEIDEIFRSGGLSAHEFSSFITDVLPDFIEDIDPMVGGRFDKMAAMTAGHYLGRLRRVEALSAAAHAAIADVHAIVGPTVPITPPKLADVAEPSPYMKANLMAARNTTTANLLAMCAVTIPAALDAASMPVGLHIVCAGGADERAIAIARAAEKVLGTARDRLGVPPLGV
jgi:aspartyl-tRNA(Asn)/glutamyl-tRNA(Gln) amidotransferase subunit A